MAQQDYSLRAKDHKKKQTVLKSLKQKAAERNDDEFYFGMVSRQAGKKFSAGALSSSTAKHNKKWTGTVAGDRGNKSMDVDTVRLLKTQDIGYLRTVRNIAAKEVRDLEERAVVAANFAGFDVINTALDEDDEDEDDFDSYDDDEAPRKSSKPKGRPNKIIFADTVEEVEQNLPDQDDDDNDMDVYSDDDVSKDAKKKQREARKRRENAERLVRKLRAAKKKLKALTAAENELELQRARMAKTATSGGITKSGKKIKIRERKR